VSQARVQARAGSSRRARGFDRWRVKPVIQMWRVRYSGWRAGNFGELFAETVGEEDYIMIAKFS
jgi:hypothetical protein